jgi:hypothetical protein
MRVGSFHGAARVRTAGSVVELEGQVRGRLDALEQRLDALQKVPHPAG